MCQRDVTFMFVIVIMSAPCLFAQEGRFQFGNGVPLDLGNPLVVPGSLPNPMGTIPVQPGSPTPPKKEDDKTKKKANDNKTKNKKGAEPKFLTRPEKPPMPGNPDELTVRPNGGGLIKFNFRYQTWPNVLDWLATISEMSLDWQELPKDFLNLTTQHEYTIVETRDMINQRFLERGFTLIENGDVLSVVAVAKLNPAMVPRIQANDLDRFAVEQPYSFVKVSFALD